MTPRRAAKLPLAFAAVALAACATRPAPPDGPRQVFPEGVYRHVATGLEFPPRADVFERLYVVEYDPQALDASGHYRSPISLGVTATVYHYPATRDLSPATGEQVRQHLEQTEREIAMVTPGAQVVGQAVESFDINGLSLRGMHVEFLLPRFQGAEAPFSSHLYLFALGAWYLKFRFTYPEDAPPEVVDHIRRFIESFRWPTPGAPA